MLSEKLLITGKSGTGKTTYFSRFILSTDHEFKFIFDHEGEFAHRLGVTPALSFADIDNHASDGFVCFDPTMQFPGELFEAFEFFADYVFQFGQRVPGRKLFCCDELQMFSSTASFSWELSRLIEAGRRYNIHCAFVSQQLNLIHNRARNQLTEIVAYQTTDIRAIEVLEQLGFCGEEIGKLPMFHFVLRSLRSGKEQRGIVSPMSHNGTTEKQMIKEESSESDTCDNGTE